MPLIDNSTIAVPTNCCHKEKPLNRRTLESREHLTEYSAPKLAVYVWHTVKECRSSSNAVSGHSVVI